MSQESMNLTLKIWRQKDATSNGEMKEYKVSEISDYWVPEEKNF